MAAAHEAQAAFNIYRAMNAQRNTYRSRKNTTAQAAKEKRDRSGVPQPIHSDEVMEAVRLLGDIDASAMVLNGTLIKTHIARNNTRKPYGNNDSSFKKLGNLEDRKQLQTRVENDDFWMPNMEHLGTQPYGGNSSYKVRNVGRQYLRLLRLTSLGVEKRGRLWCIW